MRTFAFKQVDVFSDTPLKGNPLAVVVGADGLDDGQMAAFANWTNLSETIFLLEPTSAEADYRVRIFTPQAELPFAGHPTLGACHAWLAAGGRPRGERIVQECAVGLVPLRRDGRRVAFAAPPMMRTGPLEAGLQARVAESLALAPEEIVDAQWVDNGPGWLAILLSSRRKVLGLKPDFSRLGDVKLGVVAPWDAAVDGTGVQFELRAFVPGLGVAEDPVTGSLNASVAQWLIGTGRAPDAYVAAQGTALGRAGRIYIRKEGSDIWVGGDVSTCIEGTVTL